MKQKTSQFYIFIYFVSNIIISLIILMGNSKSNQQLQVTLPINPKLWVTQGSTAYCDIIKNVDTGQYAELYTLPLDNKLTLSKEYQIYEYRRTQDLKLVSVINVHKEESELLCTGVEILKVRTQRIPYRLSDLQNLSLNEGIYILREALTGFKSINDTDGAIKINSNMICFTTKGNVKVWLNENLQKNHPEEVGELRSSTEEIHLMKTEAGMVEEVLRQVEYRLQGGQFPKRLSQNLEKIPMKSFKETINLLNSFISQEKIKLVDHIPLDNYRVRAQEGDIYDFKKKENNFDTDINDIINGKGENNNNVISYNNSNIARIPDRNNSSHQEFKNPIVTIQQQTQPMVVNMYNPQEIEIKRISSHENQNNTVFSQIPLVIQTQKSPRVIQQQKFYEQQQIVTSPINNILQSHSIQYQSPSSQQQYNLTTKTLPPLPKALSDSRAKSSEKLKVKHQINQTKFRNIPTTTVIQQQQPLFYSNQQQISTEQEVPKIVLERRNSSSGLRKSQSTEKLQPIINPILLSRRDSNSQNQEGIINLTKKDSNASNSGQTIGLVRRDSGTLISEINRKYSVSNKTNNNVVISTESQLNQSSQQQQMSEHSKSNLTSTLSNTLNYGYINSNTNNIVTSSHQNVLIRPEQQNSNVFIPSSNLHPITISHHTNTNVPINNNAFKINFAYNGVKPQTATSSNTNTSIGFSGYIPQQSQVISQNVYQSPQSQNIRVLTRPVVINNNVIPNIQSQAPIQYNANSYFTSQDNTKLSGNNAFSGLGGKNIGGITSTGLGYNNNYGTNTTTTLFGNNNNLAPSQYTSDNNNNYKPFQGFSEAEGSESVIINSTNKYPWNKQGDNLGYKYSNI